VKTSWGTILGLSLNSGIWIRDDRRLISKPQRSLLPPLPHKAWNSVREAKHSTKENLKTFPCTMAELCQKPPVIFEIDTEKNRNADYTTGNQEEVSVKSRNLNKLSPLKILIGYRQNMRWNPVSMIPTIKDDKN